MEFLDAAGLRMRLTMEAAIDALEVAFREDDATATPPRSHVETRAGSLLLMPAAGKRGVGVKLVTLTPANPGRELPFLHAVYVLFGRDTQAPLALIDGAALTAVRTAAVSGLATRHLATAGAGRLAIFGAGVQARSHLEAMCSVRPIERVTIVSRTRGRAEELASWARTLGVEASVGTPDVVRDADLVCTCTTADGPVFDGALLAAGAHVNAVGAYRPDARELDTAAVRRARVVVETREAAFAEAGDLLMPIEEGAFGREHVVADLAELVRGSPVRTTAEDITVFKSVGIAFEDLVVAQAAVVAA